MKPYLNWNFSLVNDWVRLWHMDWVRDLLDHFIRSWHVNWNSKFIFRSDININVSQH